jgi:hypothetical protein
MQRTFQQMVIGEISTISAGNLVHNLRSLHTVASCSNQIPPHENNQAPCLPQSIGAPIWAELAGLAELQSAEEVVEPET